MSHPSLRFPACLALLLLAGALSPGVRAGDEGVYGPTAPPGSAFVRVFNATAQAELEARVGDKVVSDIAAYGASEFVFLPAGRHALVAGALQQSVTLRAGRYYTAAVDGRALRLIDHEGFRNRLKAVLILYNLTDGGTLSLRTADGLGVIDNVAPGAFGSREVNAVKADLAVFDGARRVAEPRPMALERGRAFSLFVAGDRAQPVATWVVN